MSLIETRVLAARRGENPFVVCAMPSGWLVMGDQQVLPGYCLLLSDPVTRSLNTLSDTARIQYLNDMARIGDALLAVTGCARVNYETWGNTEPWLHTHIMPRYDWEPDDKRRMPACMVYAWDEARAFDPVADAMIVTGLRGFLTAA